MLSDSLQHCYRCKVDNNSVFNTKNNEEKDLMILEYESDTNRSSDNDGTLAKKAKLCLNWKLSRKFENSKQAEMALRSEGTWSFHYGKETADGKKRYYRCNKVKRDGLQCSAKLYLQFENSSDSILMFKTDADHDHSNKKDDIPFKGLSDTAKAEIDKLLDLKMKTKAIMQSLAKNENIECPKLSQLRKYLREHRRTLKDQSTLSLPDLEVWIRSHTALPTEPHEAFVVCHQIVDNSKDPAFVFALSTKYLIEIAKEARVVHADTTHKITWLGFPVMVFGTTDQNQKFHPLCLTIASDEQKETFKMLFEGLQRRIKTIVECSWNPKVLVSNDKVIQDAFLEVFGEHASVRVCWEHVKRELKSWTERTTTNKELRDNILDDADALHSVTDEKIFEAACELFLQKYEDHGEFVAYFKDHWLANNRNWFLGAAPISPSTNSTLKSFMKAIKDSYTLRERLPLSKFLVAAKAMVNQWSNKYMTNPEDSYYAKTTTFTIYDWTYAYQWARLPRNMTLIRADDQYNYFEIPADEATNIENSHVHWESFKDFKNQHFSKCQVLMPIDRNDWRNGSCNCSNFYSSYKCKHVIGLAIQLNYTKPPREALINSQMAVGEKRKAGRPAKGRRALIVP